MPQRGRAARRRALALGVVGDAALVFTLCGFAIAQPLLDLLGKNPTFFVAHDMQGSDVVQFALGVLVLPPLVLLGALVLLRLVTPDPRLTRVGRATLVGALAAVTLMPPLERAIGLSPTLWVVITVSLAILGGLAYYRNQIVRSFLAFLTPAPLVFLVLFLFVSPARTLVGGTEPAAAAALRGDTDTPVVMVVLDELPLGALLDAEGRIDDARFPGFGRLARISTWYPSATTIATRTHHAVPAIATGVMPRQGAVPIAANYPRSLFTLLARSHRIHVTEVLTRLCPDDFCRHRPAASTEVSLLADLETVYLRTLLSDRISDDWGVPRINDRWAGFDRPEEPDPQPTTRSWIPIEEQREILRTIDNLGELTQFVASIGEGRSPGVWFHHSLLPHQPWVLVPDGRHYPVTAITGLDRDAVWGGNEQLIQVGMQRLTLQLMATDIQVGAMIDRLEQTGMIDDALVVVVADHGTVFQAHKQLRAFTPGVDDETKHDVLPVPLFVKYPGQQTGERDDRPARIVDIVPTIVDALGVQPPEGWRFDGVSLLGEPRRQRRQVVVEDTTTVRVRGPVDANILARRMHAALGAGGGPHDGFRVGPHGALVGQPAAPLVRGSPAGSIAVENGAFYDAVDPAGVVPAILHATVQGVEPGEWVAVALNGTIAGIGPVYRQDGVSRVVAMLDPALMVAGANSLDAYRVAGSGAELRLLERAS